jgi:hypothetical protein
VTDPDEQAQLHRPFDRDTLRAAAHEMRSRGLTPRDIGAALQLTEASVRQLLGTPALDQQRPALICPNCWATWRAAKPRPSGLWCFHSRVAARPRGDGWEIVEHVSDRELKQLRADGVL